MAEIRRLSGRHVQRVPRLPPFRRHVLEMFAAMVIAMLGGAAVFLSVVRVTWDEALVRYPVQSLLVMAVSMSLGMVAVMRLRHHGWRRSAEMSAAMVLPVVPFVCLVVLDVTKGALCGLYCVSTVLSMLAVMYYRRGEYSMRT